jgi:hypothetical protein
VLIVPLPSPIANLGDYPTRAVENVKVGRRVSADLM